MMAYTAGLVFQFFSIILSFNSLHGYTKLDLTGDNWQVTSDGHTDIRVASKVPGSVHTALYDSGLIPDPLYRDNDVKLAWVGRSNWAYKQIFTVSSNIISSKRIQLVCEGLDTIATISLNGTEVGHSDNMFVRRVIDVTDQVKAGKTNLEVYFKSPVQEALDRVNRSNYVIPPECPSSVQNGECHVNQIRKEQCSFSWDWGPSFPTVGIWKPIYIEAFDTAVIRDVTAVVNKVASQWQVIVEVAFDVQGANDVKGRVTSNLSGLNLTSTQDVTLSASNNYVKFIISVPDIINVPLWWPNGYGSQPLFDLKVTLATDSDVTEKTIRIGFRTVELVQTYVSSKTDQGLTFYFKINGVPIFLKGSNWIPADSFQERITKDELRYLLESVANVSTNAMRVWGGGVYESNDFYELCDELGIMIWQDFMFSVALYPTYGGFLDSVSTEIKQQVWRLKPHPSIIVWAGNNENEAGLRQNWFGTNKDFTLYYIDYLVLYAKTIKLIIDEEDPTRDYLTSSPSNGQETVDEGYVAKDPGSEFYGDG
ncbi:hypothetical protein Btru_035139 [Bulinus truncatus]|nr:hypothetical protein Btru_035139 [Bulinus truncatus]